jgi:hypothetical protein
MCLTPFVAVRPASALRRTSDLVEFGAHHSKNGTIASRLAGLDLATVPDLA